MRAVILIALCGLLLSLAIAVQAVTVTFSYEEALKRSWKHEVLNFLVFVPEVNNHPETMFVTDDTGAAIPSQISVSTASRKPKKAPVIVSLIADFEPWQKRTWTLHCDEAKPALPASDLTSKAEGGSYVLSNSLIAIRTGRGEQTLSRPIDAARVPAPLLAVRGKSGKWLGRGWLETPHRVASYSIKLIDDGPIFKRVRARYQFDNGYYECTITLRSGEDVVHFHEEFDMGTPSTTRDSNFCFSLYQGFQPDTVRWTGWYVDKRFNTNDARWLDPSKEAIFPIDYAKPGPLLRLHGLFYWWEQAACYYGAYRNDNPQGDLIAAFPERPGHWSNPTVLFLESRKGPDLVLKAPMRVPYGKGVIDGLEFRDPYFSGSLAPGTPESRGIREWGMLISRPVEAISQKGDFTESGIRKAWTRYGQNPLDKIKEWALQWHYPDASAYPRGFITPAELPAMRERVNKSADLKAMLNTPWTKRFTYLVTQDGKIGDQLLHDTANNDSNWMGLLPKMRFYTSVYLDWDGDIGPRTHMHRAAGMLMQTAPMYDVAMGIPALTPEERREANALYAFLLYKLADQDYLSYGTGFHLGNVNMPAMALNVIGYSAAMVPEHPRFFDWMTMSSKATVDILRDYTAPGGAWRECPHYQLDGTQAGVMQSATVFKNSGFIDLFRNPYFKSSMLFNLKLLTPVDPRFGIRTIPAIGNEAYESTSLYGRMAAGTASSDPEYSKWMQWGWKAVGSHRMYQNDEIICDESLPASPPDMRSAHFPGFGAIMRSHFGDPNETYLAFRMGYQIEHYEDDQGNIILYTRGAPLVLDFGSLYQPCMLRSWMHNCVSFDHMMHWEDTGEITQRNFLNAVDACLGSITITSLTKYPEDPKDNLPPNMDHETKVIKPTTWTRQVMLVKNEVADAPHYVLLRDGLAGAGDQFTDFTLWCLAKSVETNGNVAHYPGQFDMDLTVTMLDPVTPEFATGQYGHDFLYQGPIGKFFWQVNGKGTKFEEIQRFIRVKRTDHQGYFAVLYPHRPTEAVPVFTPWGSGAGITAMVNGEQHIAVCAPQPGQYSQGGVSVDGQRALVRSKEGFLLLALLQGTRVQANGYELRSAGSAAVTIEGAKITGEANFAVSGELRLTLPQSSKAMTARVVTDHGEQQAAVTQEGNAIRFALPAGRCRFTLQ
ncbi:MAG: hypothetical protein ACYC7E_08255 [Armatimonadota bacterium]